MYPFESEEGAASDRMRALLEYDPGPVRRQPRCQRIVELVARRLRVPLASASLVYDDRLVHVARCGDEVSETPLDLSPRGTNFCVDVAAYDRTLVVEDARAHPVFKDNPLVQSVGGVRFFAGAPLRTQHGLVLGTLCVMDMQPRRLSDEDLELLEEMAAVVVDELELQRYADQLERSQAKTQEALDAMKSGFLALDKAWCVTQMNHGAEPLLQLRREELVGRNLWEAFPEAVGTPFYEHYHRAVREQVVVRFEEYYAPLETWYEVRAYPFDGGLSVYLDDITERRRIEEERRRDAEGLAEQERSFRALAENSPDIIGRYDRDLRVLFANPAIERATGIPRERLIGKTAGGAGTASELIPGWVDQLRLVIETGEALTVPFTYPFASGETRHIEALLVPEFDGSGKVVSVLTCGRDVTAHFESLRRIEASEARYRALGEATSSIVWRMSSDGRSSLDIVGGQLLDETIPEVNTSNWLDFVHPDDRERTRLEWSAAVEAGTVFQTDYRFVAPDGTTGWFAVRAVPVFDESGGVQEWIGTNTDITERKQSEDLLLESEARFRSLIQNSSDVVTLLGTDGTIIHQSASLERLTGHRVEDRLGRSYLELVAPQDQALVLDTVQSVLGGATGGHVQYQYRTAGGEWIWVDSQLTNMLDDPCVGAVVVNSRDVTEQVHARGQLVDSELKHRALAEQSGQLVYEYDVESGAITWSGNIKGITGHTAEAFAEVDITGWEQRVHPEDRAEAVALLGEALATFSPYEASYRFAHADGTYRHIEERGTFAMGLHGRTTTMVGLMRDVTERREQELVLRQSEGRYRALSHLVQTFAYAYDVPDDGSRPVLTWITGSVEEVLGISASMLEGMPWGAHVSEADRTISEERLEAALRGESRVDDFRVLGSDGQVRWVRFVSQPETDPETGRVVRIYGAGQDVTVQKTGEAELIAARRQAEALHEKAEAAVEALEAVLRDQQLILDSSLDVICSLDAKGRFVQVSAAAAQVWGYAPHEMEGRVYMDFVHPDDHEKTADIAEAIMVGEKVYDFQNRYIRKDGTVVPLVWSAVWSAEDQTMLCVARDRSEALEQERRRHESEERLRLITEATSDVLWDWDMKTNRVWWSRGVHTFFGYAEEDVARGIQLWYDGLYEEDRPRVLEGITAAAAAGTGFWSDDYRFVKADGSLVTVHDRARIIRTEDGKAVRMVGGMIDVTVQKQAEAELIEAMERAEEMSRLKDAFLANMSHEIRTPLTSVLGFTELLRDVVDEEGLEFVDMIEAGGRRLKETLTSVLELSQLQTGHVTLNPAQLDIVTIATETVALLRHEAERKGIQISTSGLPPSLMAEVDRASLGRILFNLIGNAVKFTGRGGHVAVSAVREQEHVRLVVTDDGPGISKEFLPKVFDAFRQESQGMNRSHEGNGLGLTITKWLVDLLGGTITVESEKRKGTTFTVLLPLRVQGASAPPPPKAVASGGKDRQVLLVEDEESVRQYVRHALRGVSVVEAASAEAALELANAAGAPFDVVLLDINLGSEKSGDVVLPELRAMASCRTAGFVAMTAYALPGDKERFLRAGFDAYLGKPFTRNDLMAVLHPAHHHAG